MSLSLFSISRALLLIGDVTINFVIKRRKQSMEAIYLEHLHIP
jgi:hypothetical protein